MSSNLQVIGSHDGLQPIKEVSVTAKQLYDNRKKIMEIFNKLCNSILSDKSGLIRIMKMRTSKQMVNNIGKGKGKGKGKRKSKGKTKKGGANSFYNTKVRDIWGNMVPPTDLWGRPRGQQELAIQNAKNNATRFHPHVKSDMEEDLDNLRYVLVLIMMYVMYNIIIQ